MSGFLLDFERPIVQLGLRITELRARGEGDPAVSAELETLEARARELSEKVYRNLSRWDRVRLARHPHRPHALDFIERLLDDFVELHGDRAFGDDPAIVAGLARLEGRPIVVVGTQKGRDVNQNVHRNFGMPRPEGYRKAQRIFALAERFSRPIVTLIDTPGAYPGLGAEERAQAEAIARSLLVMSRLRVPVIAVVTGEGGSGGALALAVANRVLMLENAVYSVISPEGCASILFRDAGRAPEAAEALRPSACDLAALGIVDEVLPEPRGGAHRDVATTCATLRGALGRHLAELDRLSPDALVRQRYERFRSMGVFEGA